MICKIDLELLRNKKVHNLCNTKEKKLDLVNSNQT